MKKRKIIYFIAEDWYFWSHRLSLARAMRSRGWEVIIVTRISDLSDQIKKEGFILVPLNHFARRIQAPWKEILALIEIIQIFRQYHPDIVHQVALKPILFGTLATKIIKVPIVINAVAGLGFLFISSKKSVSILKNIVIGFMKVLFKSNNVFIIVQNSDDLFLLTSHKLVPRNRIALIKGSGVDLNKFYVSSEPQGLPIVLLASRLLWDKGIAEFVEAAQIVNQREKIARFVLVGNPDPENPASIPEERLRHWVSEGIVEWWGYRSDMPYVLSHSHIVCLPSYREGLPKILLEAAASGKPIIATSVPGCKEIVRDGVNGFLVPPKDVSGLVKAINKLIKDPILRHRMGMEGRKIVEREFSQDKVVEETLSVYERLIRKTSNQSAKLK